MIPFSQAVLEATSGTAAICRDDHHFTSFAKLIRIEPRGGGKGTLYRSYGDVHRLGEGQKLKSFISLEVFRAES